jgi:protein phosphatase methylesterase 1
MSDLQKAWARKKLHTMAGHDEVLHEEDEGASPAPESADAFDDSSSASSVSSTGTVIPSASRQLFARPQGHVVPLPTV